MFFHGEGVRKHVNLGHMAEGLILRLWDRRRLEDEVLLGFTEKSCWHTILS